MGLADGSQRKEVIEGQRAEGAHHAQRGDCDPVRRNIRQRGQDHPGVDALQRPHQMGNCQDDDEETRSDP